MDPVKHNINLSDGYNEPAGRTGWNVSQIREIYFICPSEKEPIENV